MENYFCCTQKLRKELGIKEKDLCAVTSTESGLGSWYADLFRIGSKKNVIFVHPDTRYGIVALDIRKRDLLDLPLVFRTALANTFTAEKVSEQIQAAILSEYCSVSIAKTSNRSVVGTMVEMVGHIKAELDAVGMVTPARSVLFSQYISRIPIVALKTCLYPSDSMGTLLKTFYGFSGMFPEEDFSFNYEDAVVPADLPEGVVNFQVERAWRSRSKEKQHQILNSIWCGTCAGTQRIENWELTSRGGLVVIEGQCSVCAAPCRRLLDE